jgi:hypothetical protein
LLLGGWAFTGRRWAQLGYIALACLAPKPIFLPFLLWVVVANPAIRRPAAAIVLANAALIVLSGYSEAWLVAMSQRGGELANPINLSPSSAIGALWLPAAAVLAIVLFRRRLFGLAGLVLSPYWLPYYFLMPLLDLATPGLRPASESAASAAREPTPNARETPRSSG